MKSIQSKAMLTGILDLIITVAAIAAQMMLLLETHSFGFTIGIAFLTGHVIVLGKLIYESGYFTQLLSGKAKYSCLS